MRLAHGQFGVSWQIIPTPSASSSATDPEKANRVMNAMLKMTKIEIAELEQAAAG